MQDYHVALEGVHVVRAPVAHIAETQINNLIRYIKNNDPQGTDLNWTVYKTTPGNEHNSRILEHNDFFITVRVTATVPSDDQLTADNKLRDRIVTAYECAGLAHDIPQFRRGEEVERDIYVVTVHTDYVLRAEDALEAEGTISNLMDTIAVLTRRIEHSKDIKEYPVLDHRYTVRLQGD